MQERFILAVDITEKILRSLWKAAYRRKIHDLAHCAVDCRELLCQEQ